MIKNLIIVALLTINIVFGITLIQRTTSDDPALAAPVTHPGDPVTPATVTAAKLVGLESRPGGASAAELTQDTPLQELILELREAGLDESLVRQMVLAAINLERSTRLESSVATPYWKKPQASAVDAINRRLVWQADQRLMMLDLFGEDAANDPLFAHLFKPLNDSLPFLDSDKQIALFELQSRQDALNRQAMRGGMTRESREEMIARREDFDTSVSAILSPEERFEYDLRESRAADFLRQGIAEFDYSEQDFREIFAIRQTTAQDLAGERRPDTRDVMDQRISDYLGEARFEEYQRSQDPAFRSLKQIGERYGNTDAEVIAMYDETQKAQAKLKTIFQDETISREAKRAQTEAIWSETIEHIEKVAGEDAAASVRANGSQLGMSPRQRPIARPPFARGGN